MNKSKGKYCIFTHEDETDLVAIFRLKLTCNSMRTEAYETESIFQKVFPYKLLVSGYRITIFGKHCIIQLRLEQSDHLTVQFQNEMGHLKMGVSRRKILVLYVVIFYTFQCSLAISYD